MPEHPPRRTREAVEAELNDLDDQFRNRAGFSDPKVLQRIHACRLELARDHGIEVEGR